MTINLSKTNLPQLQKFIGLLKPLSIGCAGLAIASLAIYPLINNKPPEKAEDKVEQESTTLPPASYTIIMGESQDEVVIKFHNQNSELHLKNISTEEYNCLLNGGGVNCVLAEVYQPKLEVAEVEQKPTPQSETKRQTFKIPEIEASANTMDNIMVVGGVVIGLILINRFKK